MSWQCTIKFEREETKMMIMTVMIGLAKVRQSLVATLSFSLAKKTIFSWDILRSYIEAPSNYKLHSITETASGGNWKSPPQLLLPLLQINNEIFFCRRGNK